MFGACGEAVECGGVDGHGTLVYDGRISIIICAVDLNNWDDKVNDDPRTNISEEGNFHLYGLSHRDPRLEGSSARTETMCPCRTSDASFRWTLTSRGASKSRRVSQARGSPTSTSDVPTSIVSFPSWIRYSIDPGQVLALSKQNSNATEFITFKFLHRLTEVLVEHLKELEKESIRVYELMNEMMNFGYPQATESYIDPSGVSPKPTCGSWTCEMLGISRKNP